MPGLGVIVPVAILAGALCVDFRTSLRLMISQPICGGMLTGLILGEPVKGLLAGTLIQIMFLGNIFVRGKRILDLPVAGVTASALFVLTDLELAGDLSATGAAMVLAVFIGLLAGWAGYFVYKLVNIRLSGIAEKAVEMAKDGKLWFLSLVHLSVLAFHFIYGFVVLALLIPLGWRAIMFAVSAPWVRAGSVDVVYIFIPFIGIGSILRSQILKSQVFWFLSGLIVGAVVLFLV